jgi:NTE family protein
MSAVGERALVLGGGGASGNAWLIGIVAGLFDGGLDATEADLIIGTSAGSTAAAQISSARPAELLANILAEATSPRRAPLGAGAARAAVAPAPNHIETTNQIIREAADPAEMRRRMGAALLELDPRSDRSRQWRTTVAARLPSPEWPMRPMLIPAVDAHTGEPLVFDRHSGVDLVDAVAASTAGGFAYAIGDKRYIDGGYRADVNADLAAGYARVLIIAPLGTSTRKPLSWGLHLTAQVDELRIAGSRAETIFPDSESQSALGTGMNIMDPSRRRPSAEAGYNQGRTLAEQLAGFWR